MDHKQCTACHAPHFEPYDLCRWCSEAKQDELERRLREDDGAVSLMTIASWATFGPPKELKR